MATFPNELQNAFEIKEHLNGGAYGLIYKVIKRSNGKVYAMKVVVKDIAASSWKDIETELQVLSWVNPYKLHLDCFFISGNTFYMIIDYCMKGDLLKAIADKIGDNELFEEDEIWKYFIQICFGLEPLHYSGFIHRDLHPQNILIDENNDIKIADFGISRSSPTKSIQGVSAYQSPRTHSSDTQAKESDVWAVGCILYYLCNLEHPFGDNVNKIKYEPYKPIRSKYSNQLRYFIDWCLKKKRIERPTILDILAHEVIVKKTKSLGITIPQTSTMNATIYQIQLNKEKEKNSELENKLSKYRKKNMAQKNEIELLNAENTRLIIIINSKGSEKVKEPTKPKTEKEPIKAKIEKEPAKPKTVKESTKPKTEIEPSFPNPQISASTNDLNRNLKNIDTLRNKTAEILNRRNSPEFEMDFRETCSAYQANSTLYDPPLIQAYQDYLNAYQQKTSLYNFRGKDNKTNLIIYNTETDTKEIKTLKTQEKLDHTTCITQLPNGKLFCFGNYSYPFSGITVLVDVNGGVEVLPSGKGCYYSSCIYFNNSVYCFGGNDSKDLTLSSRFDLGQNRWIQLKKLPKADYCCNSIIFNGNILISGCENTNLLRYSVDRNSFTTIPYEFTSGIRKILINADRLYLIECPGSIYESAIGSDTNWRSIAKSTIGDDTPQVYCSYNKGGIYIGRAGLSTVDYYKFDLNAKLII